MYYTLEEGKFLVKIARKSLETYLKERKKISPPEDVPEKLREKSGAFVTLNRFYKDPKTGNVRHELRGCIGHPYPIMPLVECVIEDAINAGLNDPRFPPVSLEELKEIVIEVSVLTPPEEIEVSDYKDYLDKIRIGRDGLIVVGELYGFQTSGLLLPQVPVEYGWDVEEFLSYTCRKAGLPPDCWKRKGVKFFKFQAEIFEEIEPEGEIRAKDISKPIG